jgi:hypothetical protein
MTAAESTTPPPHKNENGVYLDYQVETIVRLGRSHAEVHIAQCDDGLFRFSTSFHYSYGGFDGPITDRVDGFQTYQDAKSAGVAELFKRFPNAWPSEPASVHAELQLMRVAIERYIAQPSLF